MGAGKVVTGQPQSVRWLTMHVDQRMNSGRRELGCLLSHKHPSSARCVTAMTAMIAQGRAACRWRGILWSYSTIIVLLYMTIKCLGQAHLHA
eukprot:9651-Eustigmatos_ZCMA.PRE.1